MTTPRSRALAVALLAAVGATACAAPDDRPGVAATAVVATEPTAPGSSGARPPDTTGLAPAPTSSTSPAPLPAATTVAPSSSAPSTAPPTTPDPAGLRVLDVLALVRVEREHPGGYSRSLFEHWVDQGYGCDTRQIVLGRDSLTPVQRDPVACFVIAGDWLSPYDGLTLTSPADVEIDHVVALKEAWDSGAWAWTADRRRAFANDLTDPRTLRAVSGASNSAKGSADPSNWLPPVPAARCPYLADWVAIKVRWGLSMDESEAGRIRNVLRDECPEQRMPAVTAPPSDGMGQGAAGPAGPGTTSPPGSAPVATAPVTGGGGVFYENCAAAWAAGAAPILAGQPGYRARLDGDGDGVACENPP